MDLAVLEPGLCIIMHLYIRQGLLRRVSYCVPRFYCLGVRMSRIFNFMAAALLTAAGLFAQVTGRVSGVVVDPAGANDAR